MYKKLSLLLIGLLFAATGCQEQLAYITVHQDGSGTIRVRHFENPELNGPDMPKAYDPVKEAKGTVKDIAQGMGAVTFVSGKPVANKRGWKGYEGLFSFKDINQVKATFAHQYGDEDDTGTTSVSFSGMPMPLSPTYSFSYTPGGKLEITAEPEEAGGDESEEEKPARDPAQEVFMKATLNGFRETILVKVDGAIGDSNAKFVIGKNKDTLVLFDVELAKIQDDSILKKITALKQSKAPGESISAPGIRFQRSMKLAFGPASDKKMAAEAHSSPPDVADIRISKETFAKRHAPAKPATAAEPGGGAPPSKAVEAKNFINRYGWSTVNRCTPEVIEKAHQDKPTQIIVGKVCSNADFAQICEWSWIREMRIESQVLTDISPLANLTELTSFKMFMLKQTKRQRIDIGALGKLKKLEKIEFYSSRVTNTDALAGLTALKDLSLYMSAFESLNFLEHTPSVERLILFGSKHTFDDYKPLLHLKRLKELDITANTQAVDENLRDLAGLTTLERFHMNMCTKATTLDFLRNCGGLREINAGSAVRLEHIDAVRNMPELATLNLNSTGVEDISVLAKAEALQRLDVGDTVIKDFFPLAGLKNMRELEYPEDLDEKQLAIIKNVLRPDPAETARLIPTGLTLVVCDGHNKVLDTVVVPDDGSSGTITFTLPEDLDEIRAFVLGTRLNEEYGDDLTSYFFIVRKNERLIRQPRVEMSIKNGVLDGVSSQGPAELDLGRSIREQVGNDIRADQRAALTTVTLEKPPTETR